MAKKEKEVKGVASPKAEDCKEKSFEEREKELAEEITKTASGLSLLI